MLDVHRLRLLRELDRRGTLAAVARALSYSPSAVSQQLSQLEAETGVVLLEPAGRGVRLTAQARILVAHTEAILERLEEAEAELRASLTEVRGTLRVASFQSVLLALVPEVLTQLAGRHPGLRVEITHQEAAPAFAGLLAHDFDVVLGEEYPGFAWPPVPGARTRLLARDELFVVVPAHGPYARAEADAGPVHLPDLAGVPWILDPASTAPGQWARDACRAAGFEPDVRYAGSDLLLQVHLAETGHAAAMIPGLLLAAVPAPAARVRALPGRPRRKLTTGVRSGADADPAVRAFRAALTQAIGRTAARAAAGTGAVMGLARRIGVLQGLIPALVTLWCAVGRKRAGETGLARPPQRGDSGAVPGLLPCRARIEPGDRVAVTGASGFIGSAVARALRARGARVVAVTEPGADCRNLAGLGAEQVVADLRDAAAVRRACAGARFVFHLAAVYRFWAPDPRVFYDVNVGGTVNVLGAARAAGCERLVFTSTVGVLGPGPAGRPADETCYPDLGRLSGSYKGSKFVAEHEVLRACGEGLDACLVLPTFPLGPGDAGPTPTGRVVLDYLNGKMPAFAGTAMNVVHVDDLAAGHVAALERGGRGRSYILGGENLPMRAILQALADCTGLPAPRRQVPAGLILAAGAASTLIEGRLLRRPPLVPLEAARMSATPMTFTDERARAEIGHTARPARAAISESARWFAANGYVAPRRAAAIRWRE